MNWNGWRTRISPPDASTMSSDECYSAILKMCEQPVSNPLDTERERRWTSRQRLTVACALRDEIERGVYTYALHVRRSCQTQRQSPLQQQHTKERERRINSTRQADIYFFFFSLFYRQSTNILIKLNFEFGAYKLCTYYKAASINGSFVIFGWQTKQSLLNNSDDDDDIHYADCEGEGRIQKRGTRRCIIADTVVGLGTCHCCCCPCCCS